LKSHKTKGERWTNAGKGNEREAGDGGSKEKVRDKCTDVSRAEKARGLPKKGGLPRGAENQEGKWGLIQYPVGGVAPWEAGPRKLRSSRKNSKDPPGGGVRCGEKKSDQATSKNGARKPKNDRKSGVSQRPPKGRRAFG